jgi:hypothetical protein
MKIQRERITSLLFVAHTVWRFMSDAACSKGTALAATYLINRLPGFRTWMFQTFPASLLLPSPPPYPPSFQDMKKSRKLTKYSFISHFTFTYHSSRLICRGLHKAYLVQQPGIRTMRFFPFLLITHGDIISHSIILQSTSYKFTPSSISVTVFYQLLPSLHSFHLFCFSNFINLGSKETQETPSYLTLKRSENCLPAELLWNNFVHILMYVNQTILKFYVHLKFKFRQNSEAEYARRR